MNEIVIDKTGLDVENLDLENAVKIIYKVDDTEYIIKHLTDLNNFELKTGRKEANWSTSKF